MVLYHRPSAMSTVGKAGFTGLHTFAKEMEKSAKNPLTNGFGRDIIIELSARERNSRADMILENDTESRRTRGGGSRESQPRKDSQFEMSFDFGRATFKIERIKRESLILAQDERWRRA